MNQQVSVQDALVFLVVLGIMAAIGVAIWRRRNRTNVVEPDGSINDAGDPGMIAARRRALGGQDADEEDALDYTDVRGNARHFRSSRRRPQSSPQVYVVGGAPGGAPVAVVAAVAAPPAAPPPVAATAAPPPAAAAPPVAASNAITVTQPGGAGANVVIRVTPVAGSQMCVVEMRDTAVAPPAWSDLAMERVAGGAAFDINVPMALLTAGTAYEFRVSELTLATGWTTPSPAFAFTPA